MSIMEKPLINKKKWTQDEFRILVVLLLTVLYPIFALSFFAIFFFLLMPFISLKLAPHIYWLTASLLWVALCGIILPCFRDTRATGRSVGMHIQEGPVYTTKQVAVQPFVKVEEVDEKNRVSILTNRSDSSESIEKGICEEKADKESLEKSKENITQSGEFLNECIGSLESDKLPEEADCEVHAEQGKSNKEKDNSTDKSDHDDAEKHNPDKDKNSSTSDDSDAEDPRSIVVKDIKAVTEDTCDEREQDEDSPEVLEPIIEQAERDTMESESLQVEEGRILKSEVLGEEQVTELEEESPVKMRKPLPTIDTSRASEYYECSMPTPKSASSDRPQSNMVFLYVNPDTTAATEEDIIVNLEGEIQEQKQED